VIDTTVRAQGAINSALAAAGQGAIFVLGGTYPVKAPVVIGNEQNLIGAGPLSTIPTAASGRRIRGRLAALQGGL
jgi:hypothetical protein